MFRIQTVRLAGGLLHATPNFGRTRTYGMSRSRKHSDMIGIIAMTLSSHPRLTRLFCVTLAALLLPAAASAQFNQRLSQADAAAMSVRMTTLEEQVRQLNGQIQQMTYQMQQLQDQLLRMSEDNEYRFQMLGQGGGSQSSATVVSRPPVNQPQVNVIRPAVQPQTLGQVPVGQGGRQVGVQGGGQPLDLSSALNQPLPNSGIVQDQSFGTGGAATQGTAGNQIVGQGFGTQDNTQLVLAPSGDPKDAYDLSYGYILRGEFDLAEQSFRQFLAQHPADPLAGNAQYWLGESQFARGRYREAADTFLKGYSQYPSSAKAPDSLYKLGMSLKELGQTDAACSSFAEIARTYPNAPQAVQERARSEMQKSGC